MEEQIFADSSSRQNLDHLFSIAYEELRKLAASVKRRDGSVTLNPTALVNEVWLKLAKENSPAPQSSLHFKRIAARAMRQVLIDASRRRGARKRLWGLEVPSVLLDSVPAGEIFAAAELLALDTALKELSKINERQASIVELRFFGGLDVAETATLLNVSEATIMREWRVARAWLEHVLRRTG